MSAMKMINTAVTRQILQRRSHTKRFQNLNHMYPEVMLIQRHTQKIQMIRIPVTEKHTQNVTMENIMLREKQQTQKMV